MTRFHDYPSRPPRILTERDIDRLLRQLGRKVAAPLAAFVIGIVVVSVAVNEARVRPVEYARVK